jgi:hypothetical protein
MNRVKFILLFLFITGSSFSQEVNETVLLNTMHSISSNDLLDYVRIQCEDKYQGRLTGTKEYQECAEWVASKFSEWGLAPAGDNGTWYQWYKIPYTLVLPDCGVSLHLQTITIYRRIILKS